MQALRLTMANDAGDSAARPTFRVLPGGATPARREDEALVAAFLVGDDEAFGELVRRHELMVLRLVRRWASTPEDARDLAQRTFLRAFEATRRVLAGARRVRGRPSFVFKAWLARIAVNLAKNHRRDEARARRVPLVVDGPAEAARPAVALEALVEAERAARVRRAVADLPRRQREVLTLRIDAELPFAEIAEALGTTENAAKVTFHHATRRLRALLEELPS